MDINADASGIKSERILVTRIPMYVPLLLKYETALRLGCLEPSRTRPLLLPPICRDLAKFTNYEIGVMFAGGIVGNG